VTKGVHRLAVLGIGVGSILLAGCGKAPTQGPIPCDCHYLEPINDTPRHLFDYMKLIWDFQDASHYTPLLTSDFHVVFSAGTDPELVQRYGETWSKADESAFAKHLFEGITNADSLALPAASHLELGFLGAQPDTDYVHPDSAAWYAKVVMFSAQLTLTFGTDSTLYVVRGRQEFFVVRGDAAVLDPGQEHRADRWYIRRWDDLSTASDTTSSPPAGPLGEHPTWGRMKDRYRR
jgi:hypothetical protein